MNKSSLKISCFIFFLILLKLFYSKFNPDLEYTVQPVYKDHPWENEIGLCSLVVFIRRVTFSDT